MVRYEVETSIQAPATEIWRLLAAVEAWPSWLPTVSSVEPLDGTPLALGRRYRVEQPGLRPAEWTVTALEAGHRFEWRARSPGLMMVGDHMVDPTQNGSARVCLSFAFHGLLGNVLGRLFGKLTHRYIRQEAEALKRETEHRLPPRAESC